MDALIVEVVFSFYTVFILKVRKLCNPQVPKDEREWDEGQQKDPRGVQSDGL